MSAAEVLPVAALALVAVGGAAVVVARDPVRQAAAVGVQGLLLAVLFTVLQAPDVALSQITVGAALTPLLILLAMRAVHRQERAARRGRPPEDGT